MIRKFAKKSVAMLAIFSMLAACTTPAPVPVSSTESQSWAISPVSIPNTQATKDTKAKNAAKANLSRNVITQESIHPNKDQPINAAADKANSDNPVGSITQVRNGQTGNGEDFKNLAASQAQAFVSNKVSDYLSQFGTVELSVSDLSNSSKVTGSLDMLLPIVDREDDLFYTQLGVRKSSQYTESWRTTINAGLGYRKFFDAKYDYMLGANVFYDQDLTVGHQRMGVGGEFWLDNLKLAANAYMPLSNWKKSPDLDKYLERPAKGFDLRAEGYLPMYPQLGGKLMYEQYFGDEVGLFGVKDRSSDPKALTVGLSYTPVPAVSLEVDHKMGAGGLSQTSGKLNFKYQLGVPWSKQFSSSEVAATRKLDAMRYDLVQRNNEIVLEYKKDEDDKEIHLPAQLGGYPGSIHGFAITFKGMSASTPVSWSGNAASFATPHVAGETMGELEVPAFDQASGINTYQLIASANVGGEQVVSNPMLVNVNPVAISITPSKATAMADGTDNVSFTARLLGVEGEPMANHNVTWQIPNDVNAVSKEDITNVDGEAVAVINSVNALAAIVSATDEFGFTGDAETDFLADKTTARVDSLVADPTTILANNSDTSTLTATVVDAYGNPVGADVEVSFSGDESGTATTDADSKATFTIAAKTAPMTVNVTAKATPADAGKTASVTVALDLDNTKVTNLVASPSSILANGTDTSTLTATVADAFGNPVGAGVEVTFSGDESGTAITDANSKATFTAPAKTVPITTSITAKASTNDAGKSVSITYDIDLSGARVDNLVANPVTLLANGSDTSVLTATVTDAFGNPIGAGVNVAFSGDITGSGTTDANSKVAITAPSKTVPQTITVNARVSTTADTGKQVSVTYDIDLSGARVDSLVAVPTTILANGTDTSTITATVTDAFGNPVGAGVNVAFSGDVTGSDTTDSSGKASITSPSSQVVQTLTVNARVSTTSDTGKSTSFNYSLDLNNLFVVDLVASETNLLANNSDTSTLTATVADAFGNPVGAGVEVTFSGDENGTAITDADSKATFIAPAKTVPITTNITAKASTNDAGKSVSITYDIDLSGARVDSLVADPASILADGIETSTVTATVTDTFGNLVGAGVNVAFSGDITGSGTTDANSKVAITAPSKTVPQTITVNARVSTTADTGKQVSITYIQLKQTIYEPARTGIYLYVCTSVGWCANTGEDYYEWSIYFEGTRIAYSGIIDAYVPSYVPIEVVVDGVKYRRGNRVLRWNSDGGGMKPMPLPPDLKMWNRYSNSYISPNKPPYGSGQDMVDVFELIIEPAN